MTRNRSAAASGARENIVRPPQWGGPGRRLAFTMFAAIDQHPRKRWVIDGLLGEDEQSGMYGMPGTAKSALAGDLGAHVAAGRRWFGRKVMLGAVLYVAAERAPLVKRRLAAWRIYHGVDDLPLAVIAESIDLRANHSDAQAIVDAAHELRELTGQDVRLVIIDTVSRVLAGGDENSSRDMGTVVANLDRIQKGTGGHVMALHHVPVSSTSRMRGHGNLEGALDTTIRLERDGHVRTATVDKTNDGPEDVRLAFTLQSVELFRDPECGDVTTAPVVVPTDAPAKSAKRSKLSGKQELAVRALRDLALSKGEPLPPEWSMPAGLKAVQIEDWRAAMENSGVIDHTEKNSRKRFWDIKTALKVKSVIGERDGSIWLAA